MTPQNSTMRSVDLFCGGGTGAVALTVALQLVLVACGGDVSGDAGMDGAAGPRDGEVAVSDGTVTVCAADSECDDGVYCNGSEACMPGGTSAGADGCVAGVSPCDSGATCMESEQRCVADTCEGELADGDGDGDRRIECGGSDCDDENPGVYGTATEVCDAAGVDEDCDPSTIQDDSSSDGDRDGDGFVSNTCFNVGPGGGNRGRDCNDDDRGVNPEVADGPPLCDLIDNDCDGTIDVGCSCGVGEMTVCGEPAPGGGFNTTGTCRTGFSHCSSGVWGECVGAVRPAAAEVCNGLDDTCSGAIDDGLDCIMGTVESCVTACGSVGERACVADGTACMWAPCVAPRDACNGCDDDADSLVDEDVFCARNSTTRGCTTACLTPGVETCNFECDGFEGCASPTEVCNFCDDDADGSWSDDEPLATAMQDIALTCASTTAHVIPTCSENENGIVMHTILHPTRPSTGGGTRGYYLTTPLLAGFRDLTIDSTMSARFFSSSQPPIAYRPGGGMGIVIFESGTGSEFVDTTGEDVGAPTDRNGISVEWEFGRAPNQVYVRHLSATSVDVIIGTDTLSDANSLSTTNLAPPPLALEITVRPDIPDTAVNEMSINVASSVGGAPFFSCSGSSCPVRFEVADRLEVGLVKHNGQFVIGDTTTVEYFVGGADVSVSVDGVCPG